MDLLEELNLEMINYFGGDPKRIQHFTKVHAYASLIARSENVDDKTLLTVEAASIVHDVGIKISEKLHGTCTGRQQEQYGPPMAKHMLANAEFPSDIIERVSYLVGHHHTYTDIDGIDLQILIEADFLVNLYEDSTPKDGILSAYNNIFKTDTGKKLCKTMFGI